MKVSYQPGQRPKTKKVRAELESETERTLSTIQQRHAVALLPGSGQTTFLASAVEDVEELLALVDRLRSDLEEGDEEVEQLHGFLASAEADLERAETENTVLKARVENQGKLTRAAREAIGHLGIVASNLRKAAGE